MSGIPSFIRQLRGGGINRARTAVLMSVGYIVINLSGIHGSLKLVHNHRMGVVTTSAVWVGTGVAFENLSMEVMLRCRVKRTLNKI